LNPSSRILVIQLARLGDVIQTTPLLQALVAAHPQEAVDVLVFVGCTEVLAGLPGLGQVYALPASWNQLEGLISEGFREGRIPPDAFRLLEQMSLPSYRRIINCTYSMLGAWLTQHLPAEERHGAVITADHEYLASGEAHVYVGSRKYFRQQNWFNLVDLWRSLAPAVPPPPGARPYAARAAELPCTLPAGRKVALNPGSGSDRRRWPPASFAWLGEALANRGFAPILLGAPPERELCAEVQMQCRIPLPNFAGQTSPAQAVHLLSQVDLLVSVDTGAVHLAAAAGTPVLGLYGVGAYFRETAPWSAGNTVLQAPLGTEIARLPPPLVLAAALHRLGAIPEASLRQELAEANFEGWETMFLPAQADPLGGLTYRPLHRHRLRLEELWTRALRHALAESFCEGQQALSMAYLRGLELEVNLSSERRELHERIAHVQAALARMAEEAALCKRLASAPDRHAADQIRGLTNSLMQTLEQLKQAVRADPFLNPVIQHLDFKFTMMPRIEPVATFAYHEAEYRRASALLGRTEALLNTFLE
jgi:ADP-heptose:LPS heptosyltransferase